MKSVWWIIAGVSAVWLWWRKRSEAPKSKADTVPSGTSIGQIGARIENPAALQDFARSLALQAEPRVVDTFQNNNFLRLIWSDGRVTQTDGSGNIISDKPFIPTP